MSDFNFGFDPSTLGNFNPVSLAANYFTGGLPSLVGTIGSQFLGPQIDYATQAMSGNLSGYTNSQQNPTPTGTVDVPDPYNSSTTNTNVAGPSGQLRNPIPTGSSGPTGPSAQDLFNQAYQTYNNTYNDLLSGLDPQKAAQEQLVNNNYGQSVSDLNAQQQQGLADLNTQRRKTSENTVSTLNDLTNNIRNQLQAGQVYLGARGAGDSSAANQYSYALAQMGNKNRGNILQQQNSIFNDIGDRESKLNNIYTQEKTRLDTEKNNGLAQIAQWYADAQNTIKAQKGQNMAQLSMQALNYALGQLNDINNQIAQRRAALDQWAINSAQTLQQAKSNLQDVANFQNPGISAPSLNGGVNYGGPGSSVAPVGFSGSTQKYDMFGNPIQ